MTRTMKNNPKTRTLSGGFTLVETVAVLVLLGIISLMAVSRYPNRHTDLIGETAILKSHLRYVQLMALANDEATYGMDFSADEYVLFKDGAPATTSLPNEASSTHSFPAGVTLTAGTGTMGFDQWGSPGGSDYVVTLSQSGETRSITVVRDTGCIR
jgi:prepilin-type N-terminal cleavage/methylation domain-containing protein